MIDMTRCLENNAQLVTRSVVCAVKFIGRRRPLAGSSKLVSKRKKSPLAYSSLPLLLFRRVQGMSWELALIDMGLGGVELVAVEKDFHFDYFLFVVELYQFQVIGFIVLT